MSTLTKPIKITLLACLILTASGCSTVAFEPQLTSFELDSEAKSFRLNPNRASIYFMRDGQWLMQEGLRITMNQTEMGMLGADSFLLVRVKPGGSYTLGAELMGRRFISDYQFELGRNYFIKIILTEDLPEVKLKFQLTNEHTAKSMILKLNRAKASFKPLTEAETP